MGRGTLSGNMRLGTAGITAGRVARAGVSCCCVVVALWVGAAAPGAVPAVAQEIPAEVPPTYEPPETYLGRAFVFEADLERGIELGWLDPATPPESVLETIRESLEQRVRRSGKFVEAVVTREGDRRFAVTFVGKQSPGFEELLVAGMSAAGRFSLHVVAEDADLEVCGSSLRAEADRLELWRAGDRAAPPSRFDRLGWEEGGPCRAISWLPTWREPTIGIEGEAAGADAPVAVLRRPSHLFRAVDIRLLKVVPLPDRELPVLDLTLQPPGLEELRTFRRAAGDADVVLAVDGRVVAEQPLPEPIENPIRLDGRFTIEELRPLVLAFAGEPLEAPLRFVGRQERELPNVKRRESPTAID